MATKKYQVFVSSTFSDLIEERSAVSRAILDMGHIPAGMELFPAADTEQMTYIKKVIDECDYYALIIAGRYGSVDSEGVSYTEREYDYAIETGKPVLAFIHGARGAITYANSETDEGKRKKLEAFIGRASTGRLVQFWTTAHELRANAIISLQKSFSENPQVGWVRADAVASDSAMSDIIKYRKQIDTLNAELAKYKSITRPKFGNAAGLDDVFTIRYTYKTSHSSEKRAGKIELTLRQILLGIARDLHTPATIVGATVAVKRSMQELHGRSWYSCTINTADVEAVLLQLTALNLVKMYATKTVDGLNNVTGYQLTEYGTSTWLQEGYRKADGSAAEA